MYQKYTSYEVLSKMALQYYDHVRVSKMCKFWLQKVEKIVYYVCLASNRILEYHSAITVGHQYATFSPLIYC